MAQLSEIDLNKAIPEHVAVIMDGNGRWARQNKLKTRIQGHEAGAESVRAVLRACADSGVRYLTLYAFSTENWKRPANEIHGLMGLLEKFLRANTAELIHNNIKLRAIGRLDDLPDNVLSALNEAMEATAGNSQQELILALSYGGRSELVDVTRDIAREVQAGRLAPAEITEETIRSHLYAPEIPDPDLMIRTSGEQRISNFLLWQLSYSELYISRVLWPDFRETDFYDALVEYQRRSRRFGEVNNA